MGAAETYPRATLEKERELEKIEKELEKREKELEKREKELDRRERELHRELDRKERELDGRERALDRRERELYRRLMDRNRTWFWNAEDEESEKERRTGGLKPELSGSNELDHPNITSSMDPSIIHSTLVSPAIIPTLCQLFASSSSTSRAPSLPTFMNF